LPPSGERIAAIITNPPYTLAREFIERALSFDRVRVIAMVLRTDFDHAATSRFVVEHHEINILARISVSVRQKTSNRNHWAVMVPS
jgi:hypothetical protein